MTTRRARRQAFTLIELLVVISIIAILSALLMPTLGGARKRSRSAACMSRLRQAGLLLQDHMMDTNGRFPKLYNRGSLSDPLPALDTVVLPKGGSTEVYQCPADDRDVYTTTGNSYSWNILLNEQNPEDLNILGMPMSAVETPMIADKEGWHDEVEDRVNILYADGHVTFGLSDFTE